MASRSGASRWRRAARILAAAAAVAGCTPSQAPPPPAAGPSTAAEQTCAELARAGMWRGSAAADGGRLVVDADDFGFAPTCMQASRGAGVTVVLTNRGRLPHTFSVPALRLHTPVDAGQTVFINIPALTRPLRVLCDYHVEERMSAAIIPAADV